MKLTRLLALASSLFIAGTAGAQTCSKLAVTSTATSVNMNLTGGAKRRPALAFVSQKTGMTVIETPLGNLQLGLASPLIFFPLGLTNRSGAASLRLPLPPSLPKIGLVAQATTIDLKFSRGLKFEFCVSNAGKFTIGS